MAVGAAMPHSQARPRTSPTPDAFVNVLGVVYQHVRTADGGDLYLTPFGVAMQELLQVGNWFEPAWFQANRVRLEGTSAVYRLPTRPVDGRSIDLVVKYCRVGEDVPANTQLLREFIDAEFNSPWEEFSLVMELRDGGRFATQQPLAIHVPPEVMQEWQTGRSEERINRIQRRHPGIALDILRQYQLVYAWIPGRNVVEALVDRGCPIERLAGFPWRMNEVVVGHMRRHGYLVADMKPVHIILGDAELAQLPDDHRAAETAIEELVQAGRYSIIDYELLLRTPEHEHAVTEGRRHRYLDDQRDRWTRTELPPHLDAVEIMGVPYIHGHVESTGGELWVVGRNARLFDYFLPERWRRTPGARLSQRNDVQYTLTKDHVRLVWKVSRVGELPLEDEPGAAERGFNSPFEEVAAAAALSAAGVPTTYMRAIYRTGSRKLEASPDRRRFAAHAAISGADGRPVLREDNNYILITGYYNGPDAWVAQRDGDLCRPMDLAQAVDDEILLLAECEALMRTMRERIAAAGWDGSLLGQRDFLIVLDPEDQPARDGAGVVELRVCDFKLVVPLPGSAWPAATTPR